MNKTLRLSPVAGGLAVALSVLLCSGATAQTTPTYPSGPGEIILPYAAGGGVDAMARAFAREAGRETSQQWIVNNREGAGGVVGYTVLARATPDGATIMFSPATPLTNSPFVN